MAESKQSSQQASQQQGGHVELWEKVIGGIGVLFVLGILAFLIYEALQPQTPPEITVRVARVQPVARGYLVEIEVKNEGELTAAAVEIEGTLTPPDEPQAAPVETSTLTIDYVPSRSSRQGGLFFQADPSQYTLEVRALGYAEP